MLYGALPFRRAPRRVPDMQNINPLVIHAVENSKQSLAQLFKLIESLLNFRFVHMAEVYHVIAMQCFLNIAA
jgi:hypothetical protein